MKYLVELELIPNPPFTRMGGMRRILINAASIGQVLAIVDEKFAPGMDCVSIKITEIGEIDDENRCDP